MFHWQYLRPPYRTFSLVPTTLLALSIYSVSIICWTFKKTMTVQGVEMMQTGPPDVEDTSEELLTPALFSIYSFWHKERRP